MQIDVHFSVISSLLAPPTPPPGLKNFGKKFLNFSMKREEPGEQKPIIWASKYEQWVQEQKVKKGGQ